jgi:hypothetical protein
MFKKSVTCKRIGKYLEKHGWSKYRIIEEENEKEGMVLTGWQGRVGGIGVSIDPMVEKNCLTFKALDILKARPSSTPTERLVGLLMGMEHLNWRLILGKWTYDPSDGEVRFELGIPIDDDDLSFEKFEHCVRAMVSAVESDGKELRALADGSLGISEFLRQEGGKTMG